jgi:hypothetical protein
MVEVTNSDRIITATNWNINSPQYIMRLSMVKSTKDTVLGQRIVPEFGIVPEFYKDMYPGSYIIDEYFDPVIQKFASRLIFETPEDKTVFLLRYA